MRRAHWRELARAPSPSLTRAPSLPTPRAAAPPPPHPSSQRRSLRRLVTLVASRRQRPEQARVRWRSGSGGDVAHRPVPEPPASGCSSRCCAAAVAHTHSAEQVPTARPPPPPRPPPRRCPTPSHRRSADGIITAVDALLSRGCRGSLWARHGWPPRPRGRGKAARRPRGPLLASRRRGRFHRGYSGAHKVGTAGRYLRYLDK